MGLCRTSQEHSQCGKTVYINLHLKHDEKNTYLQEKPQNTSIYNNICYL